MKKDFLCDQLRCVKCRGKLKFERDEYSCPECGHVYPLANQVPLMIRKDHELFCREHYLTGRPVNALERTGSKKKRGWIPGRSLNLVRDEVLKTIANHHQGAVNQNILVVGSGNQSGHLEKIFSSDNYNLVYCDVASNANVDLYCDAQELPFDKSTFDGVISTAVMEHVMLPETVADEITRVTKIGGFIYSEIPFLQGVHEGAYDFTRYSLGGHRRLFRYFTELGVGAVAGPGTAMTWNIDYLCECLFRSRKLAKLTKIAARFVFFWVKYLDYWFRNHPKICDGASATYYWGIRSAEPVSFQQIIDKYSKQTN